MTAVIIPVKTPSIAKQRLAGVLRREQRAGLVLAMLQDVLETVTTLPMVSVWVVSNDNTVLELARAHDADAIHEPVVGGYNSAVKLGLSYLRDRYRGDLNVAVVPGDVPLVSTEDLVTLTAPVDAGNRTIRLAPSQDWEGTNGMFLSSIDLLRPDFGPNSFRRYQKTCRAIGLSPEILDQSTLAFDIDKPVNLKTLIALDTQGATGQYLRDFGAIVSDSKRSIHLAADSAGQ